MVMTAGPEENESFFHEARILKRIVISQTALNGLAPQRYSNLSLDKKNWPAFCR